MTGDDASPPGATSDGSAVATDGGGTDGPAATDGGADAGGEPAASRVVVAGPDDHEIGDALDAAGYDVVAVDVANRPALEEAGIVEAVAYVLTEVQQATSISVAKDLNPDLKVVVYADGSLPDFARRQADLALDPDLLSPDAVAEEL